MKKGNLVYLPMSRGFEGIPHNVYPRPQLKRESFLNLNGEWDFASTNGDEPKEYGKIIVPFPRESRLSGAESQKGNYLFYKRCFSLPEGFLRDRVILNIGAADQKAEIFINGKAVGSHRGGYLPFSFDITDYLSDNNELYIKIIDNPADKTEPYGKQKVKRGGMWYTPVSGLWQTVWLESVPREYVRSLKIDMNSSGCVITAEGVKNGTVSVDGEGDFPLVDGKCEITLAAPKPWSPEEPNLYYFTLTSGEDTVRSYFAVRTLEIKEVDGIPRLLLNGKPYFFNGLLDQGYFSDGIYTPADLAAYEDDVKLTKELGFNMLRKHIKIEPEQSYYDCDRLGVAVFQDMVNNGGYSFLRDTALPTIGLKRRSDKRLNRSQKGRENFLSDMEKTVTMLYNHPSICLWTIFNEGWGQFESSAAYRRLKELDSSRFIDSASGWFSGGKSDVVSEHVYFKPYRHKSAKKPVVLSEFGGYAHQVEGHCMNPDKQYGYRKFSSREELAKAIETLYKTEVIPAVEKGLCAAVYTQLSDVEDETNGLITYDRKVIKVDSERFKKLFKNI
ncbi:MAG: glycoside hydrolase family 2 [Ruminococcaceae bacterium]|nr:glycoside hydrolase family 2 [Oscillospiraceae bacterium]